MITEDDKKAAKSMVDKVDFFAGENPEFYFGERPHSITNKLSCYELCKKLFLAGVAHARKPHVVADNPTIPDVPPFESIHKEYLVYTTFGDFGIYTRREQTESSKAQWVTENGERFFSNHIKYWWPLPELKE